MIQQKERPFLGEAHEAGEETITVQSEIVCDHCSSGLTKRENNICVLLVCMNKQCSNFWNQEGAQVTLLLK